LEWEAEEKAKAAGLAVNHVMKCQNQGQFRALPPPYHHQSFRVGVPANASIHSFGATVATTPTHARATTFGVCALVAEPTHPPSNTLRPTTTTTTSTKARGTCF
jgi:hypothetical protein